MNLLPSVTESMSPWVDFSRIPADVLVHASERGTDVHRVCLDLYAHGLPVIGMDEEIEGYFESFRRWFDRMIDTVIATETRLFDSVYGYSGQIDLLATAKGKFGGEIWLVDLKTPIALSKAWRVQLSAYRQLVVQDGITPDRCGTLRLSKEGKLAKMDWYEGSASSDFSVFLSCLTAHRYFKQK